jgi:hypothetical protein
MSYYRNKLPPLFNKNLGYNFRSSIKSARSSSEKTNSEYIFSNSPRRYGNPNDISLDKKKKLSNEIDISINPEDNKLFLFSQFNINRNVFFFYLFSCFFRKEEELVLRNTWINRNVVSAIFFSLNR